MFGVKTDEQGNPLEPLSTEIGLDLSIPLSNTLFVLGFKKRHRFVNDLFGSIFFLLFFFVADFLYSVSPLSLFTVFYNVFVLFLLLNVFGREDEKNNLSFVDCFTAFAYASLPLSCTKLFVRFVPFKGAFLLLASFLATEAFLVVCVSLTAQEIPNKRLFQALLGCVFASLS